VSEQASFKIAAIAENHRSVQGQARFRAIPIDELVNGMTISALTVDAGQTVQYCRFREFKIR